MGRERVGRARDADHARVGGLRSTSVATIATAYWSRSPAKPGGERLHDPQHRGSRRSGRRAQCRSRSAWSPATGMPLLDRQRHQRDDRHPDEHERDGHRSGADGLPQRRPLDAHLGGKVRGGLDPGVGDHRDRHAEEEIATTGARSRAWTFCGDRAGVEVRSEPEHDDQQHAARGRPSPARRAPPAGRAAEEVVAGDRDQHRDRDHQVDAVVAELGPERRQVMADRERADRDQDQEVEQDRPAGDEARAAR